MLWHPSESAAPVGMRRAAVLVRCKPTAGHVTLSQVTFKMTGYLQVMARCEHVRETWILTASRLAAM